MWKCLHFCTCALICTENGMWLNCLLFPARLLESLKSEAKMSHIRCLFFLFEYCIWARILHSHALCAALLLLLLLTLFILFIMLVVFLSHITWYAFRAIQANVEKNTNMKEIHSSRENKPSMSISWTVYNMRRFPLLSLVGFLVLLYCLSLFLLP